MTTPGKSSIMRRGGAMLAAVIALATGYWLSNYLLGPPDLSGLKATVLSQPRDVQPFTLVDHTGKSFDNRSLLGHWSFVFFGYTHCPDVCPTTLSVLNSVASKLEDLENQPRFVFISIDPERDTPEKLGQFLSYFNGTFIGATGTDDAVNALTSQLGVIYARVEDHSGADSYLMDHSASILLFDPAGRFHAVFTPPLDAAGIASDFIAISESYK